MPAVDRSSGVLVLELRRAALWNLYLTMHLGLPTLKLVVVDSVNEPLAKFDVQVGYVGDVPMLGGTLKIALLSAAFQPCFREASELLPRRLAGAPPWCAEHGAGGNRFVARPFEDLPPKLLLTGAFVRPRRKQQPSAVLELLYSRVTLQLSASRCLYWCHQSLLYRVS